MLGELTRGRAPARDTAQLLAVLASLGHGDSDKAYIAKRLTVGVERRTLPDDVIADLTNMSPVALNTMINRMAVRQSTIYNLPRQLVHALAQKFATGPKGMRSLQL
jgi:hypothetical protein